MRSSILMTLVLALGLGCAGEPPTETSTADATTAAHASDPGAPEVLTGEVLETMDAAGYTYFRIEAGDGAVWAAANQFDLEVGERVTIPLEMPMTDFHSDSLDRTFDLIYFVSVVGREGGAPIGGTEELGLPPGHPNLAAFDFEEPTAEDSAPVAVEGALPIAEVWARRAELAGTQVTVAGRIVKYNGGILGTNWLHLQDGSGVVEDGTNDLTVTTATACAVGDIVTATGTLAIDRDFGAGYTYTVILEDAAVVK